MLQVSSESRVDPWGHFFRGGGGGGLGFLSKYLKVGRFSLWVFPKLGSHVVCRQTQFITCDTLIDRFIQLRGFQNPNLKDLTRVMQKD